MELSGSLCSHVSALVEVTASGAGPCHKPASWRGRQDRKFSWDGYF